MNKNEDESQNKSDESSPKNILTIGAYERDNFGDLLFFIILEKAIKDLNCNLVAGSIIFSDMREYFGRLVYPYHILLTNYKWDAIIVVGGDIGKCDIESAIYMSIKHEYFHEYFSFKNSAITAINGQNLAYLPDVKSFENNQDACYVINSVGGFNAWNDLETEKKVKKILLSADSISVRNKSSHAYLDSIDVENNLVPDVVHTIPLYHQIKDMDNGIYFLFQMNERLIRKYSIDSVSENLCEVIRKCKCKVYLFMAGTIKAHDNIGLYRELKTKINGDLNEQWVDIITERNPLTLVDWIANSKLWIGSSLHGRIVSTAYSIPRISFRNQKVSDYVELWDSQFPYDVDIDDLLGSCEYALSIGPEDANCNENRLTKKAESNLKNILHMIFSPATV